MNIFAGLRTKHFCVPLTWRLPASLCVLLVVVAGCSVSSASSRDSLGFVETSFTDKNGDTYTYLVYLPYDFKLGQKRPLLLFLNGVGENGVDGYWTLENNFGIEVWEMKRSFPFVCAIPQCPKDERWEGDTLQRAIEFAEQVEINYGTDQDRMYITGVSEGGRGVWNAIEQYPDKFAAALPLCGTPSVENVPQVAGSGVPIWNHYNEKDEPELVDANRKVRTELLEAGASPLFSEYQAKGHNCWDRVYRSTPVYQWLLEQRWSDRQVGSKFKLLTADEVAADWQSTTNARWQVMGQHLLSPESSNFGGQESLIGNQGVSDLELHVDACLDAEAKGCRIGVSGGGSDENTELLLEVVLPLSDVGLGEVRLGDLSWSMPIDPLAQRQLLADHANDLRMACGHGSLRVMVNGAVVVDTEVPSQFAEQSLFYPVLFADPGVRWQLVRTKDTSNSR